ncbi:MAG: hypothetical protein LUG12_07600 [Erysipelotrichaceae bacterium]|nr:hypothetical protein [Erysipelotrichaceae bacterium]
MNVENDWMNESFAQYSSLMLVRKQYGLKAYDSFINQWKELSKDLSSLSKLNENTTNKFNICYYKGPYLLYLLNKEIGEESMLELLKNTFQSHISTSKQFIKYYEENE